MIEHMEKHKGFPGLLFFIISYNLNSTEMKIGSVEYIRLVIVIILPFLIYYTVESIRYFKYERGTVNKQLFRGIFLFVAGVVHMFFPYFMPYSEVEIY